VDDGVEPAPVTGFSHVQLLVSDVAASERWYSTVLGADRLTAGDDGRFIALRHPPSRVVVVLTAAGRTASDAAPDAGGAGGLDHLAFAVPDGPTLERWADRLTACGIDHPGVVLELGKPSLVLTDPDGIRIELVAPRPRG
jgi:catechol 2,3-dioxygenase-like lactoylglutathione lyase family enzyme